MKSKIIFVLALIALLSISKTSNRVDAQVFILSEDEFINSQRSEMGGGILPDLPENDQTTDDYAPLGSGVLLLGCLGGAYLLGKRKTRKD